jgi:hypothetical protein
MQCLLVGIELLSEGKTQGNIVLSEVYQHIHNFQAVLLPPTTYLLGLSWVDHRENQSSRQNALYRHKCFIEVLGEIFSIGSVNRKIRGLDGFSESQGIRASLGTTQRQDWSDEGINIGECIDLIFLFFIVI